MTQPVRPLDPDRSRRILEAGMRLFARLPYADVHMEAVAAEAGVAKPTLYRYVPTKEALFIAGLAWTLADLREAICATRSSGGDEAERLEKAVALILERIGRLSPALHAIESRSSDLGERSRRVLREGFDGLRDTLAALLRDGAGAGRFDVPDVDLAVLMMLGGIRMAVHGTGRQAPSPAAVAAFFLNGLRAGAARPQPAARRLGAVA
ncbi:TetR/AcrR family transcriptional regulator [Methylobacterium sp. ID0610]|uniref:TetR/AcrR family transcriptional regulator n=1 Tax=Methylobacterium carpenticola TaxID=3344827 RepID=UPI0036C987F7